MEFAIGIMLAVTAMELAFAWGTIAGRGGSTRAHRIAFMGGLTGLMAIPAWFLGLAGLAAQHLFAQITSPSGLLLVTMTIVLVGALACVVYAAIKIPASTSVTRG